MCEIDFEQLLPEATRIATIGASQTVRRLGPTTEAADDMAQDALLEVWRKRFAYDPQRGSWRTFSESVVRNKLASLKRHKNARCRCRRVEVDIDSISGTLHAPNVSTELRTDVHLVLAGLSAFDRTVALSLAEYSASETSILLGVSRAAVYRTIGRLRAAFISAGFIPQQKYGGAQ